MKKLELFVSLAAGFALSATAATDFTPAPQRFRQEVAQRFGEAQGLPSGAVQLIDLAPGGVIRVFTGGRWYERRDDRWRENVELAPRRDGEFVFADASGQPVTVPLRGSDVRQLIRFGTTNFLATPDDLHMVVNGKLSSLGWPSRQAVNQIALSPEGALFVRKKCSLR
jgi:hypothetical protein